MAIGPIARILAQIVVPVVAVLARALPSAYAQALQNARKAGVDAAEASAPVFGKRITQSEALQVLNLTKEEIAANPEAIQKVSAKLKLTRQQIPIVTLDILTQLFVTLDAAIRTILCSE
ncbi:MAG: hypothetical protein SGARI_004228 [Bacillariaceae sp.]